MVAANAFPMNPELIETLLERKFVLALVAQVASVVLIATGDITGDQWTTLMMVVLGSFTLGNVAEQFGKS